MKNGKKSKEKNWMRPLMGLASDGRRERKKEKKKKRGKKSKKTVRKRPLTGLARDGRRKST